MAVSKADKKDEKDTLEEFRRREGFLPYYSDTFFEGMRYFRYTYSMWIFIMIMVLELIVVVWDSSSITVIFMVMLCLFLVWIKMRNIVVGKMKRFGYQMEEYAMIRMAWGRKEVIPYTDIQSALMTEPVKMTIKEIIVPSLHGDIRFHYEVGNAKQQKHVMDCYDILRRKVQCGLPEMMKENISSFDRMYTYNNSFRSSCFWLFVVALFMAVASLQLAEESFDVIACMIPVGMQCYQLNKMASSIRLGMKNAEELQQSLTQYQGISYHMKYHKKWEFALAASMVIGLNFLIVWYCWRIY